MTTTAARRRPASHAIALDRALEALPLFRLSDSADASPISYTTPSGGRWRVIPAPGDRLPGTFDQDVYVEIIRRFDEAGAPASGEIAFTLHDFLRSMGRRVDGRTYEQLRSSLGRLQRTHLESTGAYWSARANEAVTERFSLLSAIRIDRRRASDREQLGLFSVVPANEPGDARVTIAPQLRANISAGYTVALIPANYLALSSPVARRLYRLLAVAGSAGEGEWAPSLAELAEALPLAQRYPSHLQRVLQPAHEMLVAAGLVRSAEVLQGPAGWMARYQV